MAGAHLGAQARHAGRRARRSEAGRPRAAGSRGRGRARCRQGPEGARRHRRPGGAHARRERRAGRALARRAVAARRGRRAASAGRRRGGPEHTLAIARDVAIAKRDGADETASRIEARVNGVHVLATRPVAADGAPWDLPEGPPEGVVVDVRQWDAIAVAVHPVRQHRAPLPSPFPYLPLTPQELLTAYLDVVGVAPADAYSAQVTHHQPFDLMGRTSATRGVRRTGGGPELPCADGKPRRRMAGGHHIVIAYRNAARLRRGPRAFRRLRRGRVARPSPPWREPAPQPSARAARADPARGRPGGGRARHRPARLRSGSRGGTGHRGRNGRRARRPAGRGAPDRQPGRRARDGLAAPRRPLERARDDRRRHRVRAGPARRQPPAHPWQPAGRVDRDRPLRDDRRGHARRRAQPRVVPPRALRPRDAPGAVAPARRQRRARPRRACAGAPGRSSRVDSRPVEVDPLDLVRDIDRGLARGAAAEMDEHAGRGVEVERLAVAVREITVGDGQHAATAERGLGDVDRLDRGQGVHGARADVGAAGAGGDRIHGADPQVVVADRSEARRMEVLGAGVLLRALGEVGLRRRLPVRQRPGGEELRTRLFGREVRGRGGRLDQVGDASLVVGRVHHRRAELVDGRAVEVGAGVRVEVVAGEPWGVGEAVMALDERRVAGQDGQATGQAALGTLGRELHPQPVGRHGVGGRRHGLPVGEPDQIVLVDHR